MQPDRFESVRMAPEVIAELEAGGSAPVHVMGVTRYEDGTFDLFLSKPEEEWVRKDALLSDVEPLALLVRNYAPHDGSDQDLAVDDDVRSALRTMCNAKTGDHRDEAIRRVDQRHGYTVEGAPDPDAHRAEYDAETGMEKP